MFLPVPLVHVLSPLAQPGHLVRDCPTKYAVGDTGGRKPREGYVCRACGGDGHYLDDCPVANHRHPGADRPTGKKGRSKEIARKPHSCPLSPEILQEIYPNYSKRMLVLPVKSQRSVRLIQALAFPFRSPLSFPSSKHLIVAIGEECYVALPKGQIIPTQSAAERVDVPGGGHVLIVPITHYPTLLSIPPDQSPPVLEETEKCVTASVGPPY